MTTRKKEIEAMVKKLSDLTGVMYKTDYSPQYGGYNLYYRRENGGDSCGEYGFDYRKSTTEMRNYLESVITLLEKGITFEVQKFKDDVYVVTFSNNDENKCKNIHEALECIANYCEYNNIFKFNIEVK